MAEQLLLLQPEGDDWRLDTETKEIGLRGIAEAKRILLDAMNRSEHQRTAA
ncbi:MAG TPA: hypothetical protein VNF71_05920 [Acidimicrobiales bacterium]|nr:hypothetical protein [Acidimicrobiales bacterium]